MKFNLQDIEVEIVNQLKSSGATMVGVFGSYARGEANENSDLDILVDFNRNKRKITLFDFIRMKQDLSNKLGIYVDLVSKKGINPYMEPYIKEDLKVLYEEK